MARSRRIRGLGMLPLEPAWCQEGPGGRSLRVVGSDPPRRFAWDAGGAGRGALPTPSAARQAPRGGELPGAPARDPLELAGGGIGGKAVRGRSAPGCPAGTAGQFYMGASCEQKGPK